MVLTGAGRFFSAGGDLKAMAASPLGPGPFVTGIAEDLHKAIATFARMDAVLITAVNGVAAGAGFSLAVTGDLVLAATTAKFTMAYTKAGLSPDGSASYYLPRLVGVRRTQELMLTNRTLTADEALAWGAGHRGRGPCRSGRAYRCPGGPDRFWCKGFARGGQEAGAGNLGNSIEEQMALEGRLIGVNADAPDGREGIDAFLNKRAPKFA